MRRRGLVDEGREADRFLADLLGGRRQAAGAAFDVDWEEYDELVEVCGFFGPNDVQRTEQEVRAAVVAQANAEWNAWHPGGTLRREADDTMFGRLIGYYLAANSDILPDTLTAMQATALGPIDYGPLLTATTSTRAAERRKVRKLLLAGAPGAAASGLPGRVDDEIDHAGQAHDDSGDYSAWSGAFVVRCVRGAQIAQGLEAVIAPGRTHVGRDELLLATLKHAVYTVEARQRRAQRTPRRRGTYHAFEPTERKPLVGDIIVQDRDASREAAVATLATVAEGLKTHGDIVVEVQPRFVVTVGGNLGGSVRRRRYPLDARGFLVVNSLQLYTQEDDAGVLPNVPMTTRQALAGTTTRRVFALLSPIEECAAVPGQPYQGGILT